MIAVAMDSLVSLDFPRWACPPLGGRGTEKGPSASISWFLRRVLGLTPCGCSSRNLTTLSTTSSGTATWDWNWPRTHSVSNDRYWWWHIRCYRSTWVPCRGWQKTRASLPLWWCKYPNTQTYGATPAKVPPPHTYVGTITRPDGHTQKNCSQMVKKWSSRTQKRNHLSICEQKLNFTNREHSINSLFFLTNYIKFLRTSNSLKLKISW